MADSLHDVVGGLPHGDEFRFVDSLCELIPGKSAIGIYRIRGDEAFLAGHFPGRPIMPGVLLAEAIAQVAGIAAQSDPERAPLADLRLAGLKKVSIRGAAVPGDELRIEAWIDGRMGGLVQAQGRVKLGEQTLATAVVSLSGSA